MRQSDILDELKRKHPDLTEETIKLILKSFHDGFRYYLSRPHEAKSGILINNFLCAYIPAKRIQKFINDMKTKGVTTRKDVYLKTDTAERSEELLSYYENLLKIVNEHERQNGKKRHDDGSIGRVSIKLAQTETDQSE